ncbi:MAG: RNA methyltransferase [Actinobacteria bacterium]|nr:RNA methyltransferase [Thermoleophilia bacterium]MCB9011745.1 RNA methyltransferase [Actinomycetota bacterium]
MSRRGPVEAPTVYGRNPVRELIRAARRPVHEVRCLPQLQDEGWLRGVRVRPASRAELGQICGSSDHQGIVARCDPYPYADLREILEVDGPIVVLDGAQDPRNLGAISRVADGAGAAGIVIARRGSPGVTAVVCKASAGAIEHQLVARVDSIAGALGEARDRGRLVVGSAPDAETDFRAAGMGRDSVIVMGSEGAGLRPRVAAACSRMVRIPMAGRVDSLNISVAAALLLFEARRPI